MAYQADPRSWVRSTRCDTGTCLEATMDHDDVLIRNSTNPDGAMISLSRARWAAFVADLKRHAALAQ